MDEIKVILDKLWNGKIPLSKTFWLYYFVGILVLRIVAGAIGPLGVLLILGWAGFMVVPIWRSASNYKGPSPFGLLAKVAAVLIALGVLTTVF